MANNKYGNHQIRVGEETARIAREFVAVAEMRNKKSHGKRIAFKGNIDQAYRNLRDQLKDAGIAFSGLKDLKHQMESWLIIPEDSDDIAGNQVILMRHNANATEDDDEITMALIDIATYYGFAGSDADKFVDYVLENATAEDFFDATLLQKAADHVDVD